MTDPEQKAVQGQHNHGPGTFIGGDNYGSIRNELLDPKTKITLAKLSQAAPELARILEETVRDGVISPSVVSALENAVRSINMDVAEALMLAGRNINADVAEQLWSAGNNINEDVASKFVWIGNELRETVRELDQTLHSLNQAAGQINIMQSRSAPSFQSRPASNITSIAQDARSTVRRPPSTRSDNWKSRLELIAWSFGIGVVAGAIIMYNLIKH